MCTELFEIKFRKFLDILTIGWMTGKGGLLELFEVLSVKNDKNLPAFITKRFHTNTLRQ